MTAARRAPLREVDVAAGVARLIGPPLSGPNHGKYKWGGGAIGPDGRIYAIPSDATAVLRIDPVTEDVQTLGDVAPTKNKWQNGIVGRDGAIYAIPADAEVRFLPPAPPSRARALPPRSIGRRAARRTATRAGRRRVAVVLRARARGGTPPP